MPELLLELERASIRASCAQQVDEGAG